MPACSAFGCTNRPSRKIPGVTFHRFPKNTTLRNKWILAVRRADFQPSNWSVLCSEHFSEDQIDRTSKSTVRLREKAVPNIFKHYPKNIEKKVKGLSSTKNESMLKIKEKRTIKEEKEDENCTSAEELDDPEENEDEYCTSVEESDEPEESIADSEDTEQINSSNTLLNDKGFAFESLNDLHKNGISLLPKILKIISGNVSHDASSNSSLNPNLICNLSSSFQAENSSVVPNFSDSERSAVFTQAKHSNLEVMLQRQVQELETVNQKYRKKIKGLQQTTRRQKAKIETLKNRIKELERNQTTDEDISEDSISENEIYEELLKHQRENDENSS